MVPRAPTPAVVVLNDYCYVQGGASRVAIDEALGLASKGLAVSFVGGVGLHDRQFEVAVAQGSHATAKASENQFAPARGPDEMC